MRYINFLKLYIKYMIIDKPKLVDYSLFDKPKKIIKNIKIVDNSLYINIVGILIIMIGIFILIYRFNEYYEREQIRKNNIIELNEYVKQNIK